MKSTIKRLHVEVFVLSAIEILAVAALILLIFFVPAIKDAISYAILLIILAGVVIFNVFFMAGAILKVSKLRRKSDLVAADLIGNDVQEAYNFGSIGLVVVNKKNDVLWVSEFFRERKIDILDKSITEWKPELAELFTMSSESSIKVEIDGIFYQVKFLQDAGLYIFKDITEYENLSKYNIDHAPVVGYVMIDNYSDISVETDEANDTATKVKNLIFDYAKEHNVLLRRYRADAYMFICTHASLETMLKDKFSILDDVHNIKEKDMQPPTLSAGIAYDFPDVVKLAEMANSALDIAMSRGGGQVVVSKYGAELRYFGGKTAALENRNKVKIRVMADSVISLIKHSTDVIIMGHTDMDMDAFGACLGMKAICEYCQVESKIIYDPKLTERKTRLAIQSTYAKEQLDNICYTPAQGLEKVRANTMVIVCDVHRPSMTMAPKILEKANKIMVIDHHRRSEEFIESPVFSYIDPSASSSCELIAELIRYSTVNPPINLPSDYATFMLSGIFLDTNFFKSRTCGIRTFEASMILKEYDADNFTADEYLKDEFEEFSLITKVISTLQTPYYGVVYCKADDGELIDQATLAKVANQCLQMKGVNACFVIGNINEKDTKISCRSDGTINVQLLAEKMNGGGHFTSAATVLQSTTVEQAERQLLEILDSYLNDAKLTAEK